MNSTYIFLAKDLIFVLPVIILYYAVKLSGDKRLKFIATIGLTAMVAVIMAKILSKFYYHPRPFMVSDIKPLIAHSADNGFPSEHASYAMALATALYLFTKKLGKIAIALAILVAIGRVLVHVHSPIDIIGGILVGIISANVAKVLSDKYFDQGFRLFMKVLGRK